MTFSNVNALELLGKQVSFNYLLGDLLFAEKGIVTSIVFSISRSPEVLLDDGQRFYSFSELTEFKILDSDPVADAFEALITDNKDFIDSLSKPTL